MFANFLHGVLIFTHLVVIEATTINIQMPDVSPQQDEEYLCTYKKLPRDTTYAVKFKALADKHTAHHILMYACHSPEHHKTYWNCAYSVPCAGDGKIIFAWAKNAPAFELPDRVGFELNYDEHRYLVIQIHYARPLLHGETDNSGVEVSLTYTEQRYLAGVYLFETSNFEIPPNAKGYHADISCLYRGHSIAPFAFRTHAHARGRVISAYRIRDGVWRLIGKGNPQEPQAFYLIGKDKKFIIHDTDRVAARCTYDSNSTEYIQPGSWSSDEMCNFYMMYYAKPEYIDEISDGCHRRVSSLDFPKESDIPISNSKLLEKTATTTTTTTLSTVKTIPTNQPIITTNQPIIPTNQPIIQTNHPTKAVSEATVAKTTEGPTPVAHKNKDSLKPVLSEKQVNTGVEFGQISGVSIKSDGTIVVFHRGDRIWDSTSFDDDDVFLGNTPIHQHTVLGIDSVTGKVLYSFGKDMFYMPHGLTIDHEDNYWITDVAMHQIFKFSGKDFSQLLVLGEKFKPGKSEEQFCKPADIAVAKNGEFFVADGYCNSRIMKFSSDGKLLTKWGRFGTGKNAKAEEFYVPHSLTLDHEHNHLYIADRENGRIQKYTTAGQFVSMIIPEEGAGRLFAVTYSNYKEGILYAVSGEATSLQPSGYTINPTSEKILNTWNTGENKLKKPHDVAVSKDNKHLYVVEIGPNKLWKFDINTNDEKTNEFPWVPINKVKGKKFEFEDSKKGKEEDVDDPTLVPAIIIVIILALPLVLIIIGVITQHIRFKRKRNRAVRDFHKEALSEIRNELCFGCFVAREYKYDLDNQYDGDFEKLIKGEIVVDEENEELFTRKA